MRKLVAIPALALLLGAAAAPVQTAPIRTLVYHFTIDARGFGTAAGAGAHGVVSTFQSASSGARSGQLRVEVAQATQDGGLVVDVTETIDRVLRPLQTVRCALYGATTDVICDQNLNPTSEEKTLLTYLGRAFYDPASVDANGHWHTTPKIHGVLAVDNNFTVTATDGDVLTIGVARRESGGGYLAVTSGTLLYDGKMDIPTSIHLAVSAQRAGGQGDQNVDLKLLSDSMADSSSINSH
jgi:hypothetical protein